MGSRAIPGEIPRASSSRARWLFASAVLDTNRRRPASYDGSWMLVPGSQINAVFSRLPCLLRSTRALTEEPPHRKKGRRG